MLRTQIIRSAAIVRARPFSTSFIVRKDASETIKDAASTANRTVSDQLLKGLNKSAELAESAKQGLNIGASEAQANANELSGEASKRGNIASGKAQGTAHELAGKAQGAADELAGKAKGAAEQVKGKLS